MVIDMSKETKVIEQTDDSSAKSENKVYDLRSSAGTYMSLISRGRMYTTVTTDEEKMSINVSPAKRNMIPVIYFEDITAVMTNLKLPGYWVFFIIVALMGCAASPAYVIFAPIFIWLGLNRKITICIRSGNKAILYVHNKKTANELLKDIKSRAKIS